VSTNVKLTDLRCGGNRLKSLDISRNLELETILTFNNEFECLDMSNHKKLQHAYFYADPSHPQNIHVCN
jgi:hypothetical protein